MVRTCSRCSWTRWLFCRHLWYITYLSNGTAATATGGKKKSINFTWKCQWMAKPKTKPKQRRGKKRIYKKQRRKSMTIFDFVSLSSSNRRHCPGACLHLILKCTWQYESANRAKRRNGNVSFCMRDHSIVCHRQRRQFHFPFFSFFLFSNSAQNGNHIVHLIFFRFWCCHSKPSSHSNGIVGAFSVTFGYNSDWSTLKKTMHTPGPCTVCTIRKLPRKVSKKKFHHRPFIEYNFSFIEVMKDDFVVHSYRI